MKSISILAALLLAAVASGCASVSLDGNGGNGSGWAQQPDIMEQLAKDSQGGDA